jgi:hypothetical protein
MHPARAEFFDLQMQPGVLLDRGDDFVLIVVDIINVMPTEPHHRADHHHDRDDERPQQAVDPDGGGTHQSVNLYNNTTSNCSWEYMTST